MKRSKKSLIIASVVALVAVVASFLTACNGGKKYFEQVSSYKFWENDGKTAVAQTHVYDMVQAHLDSQTESGKTKKVLVLGYDGARAELLSNVRASGVNKDGNDIYSGDNPNSVNSAINHVIDDLGGKAYLSFAGGDTKDNFQATSTAPGWASITTGAWGNKNGAPDNPDEKNGTNIKNLDYKTFMLQAAENRGMKSIMLASWDAHKTTYKKEMEYVEQKGLPMEFYGFGKYGYETLIDENGDPKVDDEGNEITRKYDDNDVHNKLLSCVTEGSADEKDVIFCIYDWTDHNGHGTGFTNENRNYVNAFRNSDTLMYNVISAVEARSNYANEDWLIILTADHGGIKTWHGEQNPECRTTFIVTNKPELMKTEYMCKNYDGYKEN